MAQHKLDLQNLSVESFETTTPSQSLQDPYAVIIKDPNDPTAATFCFYCPPETLETCF